MTIMCLSIDFIVPLSLSYQFISTVQLLCRLNWDFALLHLGTLTYVLWHALNQFYAAIDFSALLSSELPHTYINQYIKTFCFSFCLLLSVPAFALTFRVLGMAMRAVLFAVKPAFCRRERWFGRTHTAELLVFIYNSIQIWGISGQCDSSAL